jgi:hypothetical protein
MLQQHIYGAGNYDNGIVAQIPHILLHKCNKISIYPESYGRLNPEMRIVTAGLTGIWQ